MTIFTKVPFFKRHPVANPWPSPTTPKCTCSSFWGATWYNKVMSSSFHTFYFIYPPKINILIITIAKIITSHIISSLYHHRILSIPTSWSIHFKNHHRYHHDIMTTTKLSWLLPWVVYQHRSLVKCRATKLTVHDPCRLILGNVFYLLIVIFHCFQHMSCCHHGYDTLSGWG